MLIAAMQATIVEGYGMPVHSDSWMCGAGFGGEADGQGHRPPLAAGNVAEVFELGGRVVKLYRRPEAKPAAFREAAVHAAVEAMGLPVPAVWGTQEFGGRWGVIFDRVDGMSFADRMRGDPAVVPGHLEALARLQARLHEHSADQLRELKRQLAANVQKAQHLDDARRCALLAGLAGMPEGERLCHGDFHPGNVLGEVSRPVVIDWPDAVRGDPAADYCRSHLLLRLHAEELAEPYLDACCRAGRLQRRAILAWLPYVAAARLAEDVPAELGRLSTLARAP
jgi:aminoglycoside phosphotransferase (APT) family kinase protein